MNKNYNTDVMNDSINDDSSKRFQKLLRLIFAICELCGFHLEGRITVRDEKTGRIWK